MIIKEAMHLQKHEHAKKISQCLQLAVLLEASAHKPGNISVVTNFEKTRYEHFLASAIAAGPSFEFSAERGVAISEGKIDVTQAEIGLLTKNCVNDINAWQYGGNTLLGAVILLMPMAAAAGMIHPNRNFSNSSLRRNLKLITESTTPEDAVNMYKAIKTAKPNGLGKAPDLDINDPTSTKRIIHEHISLYKIFIIAEKYDNICSEWINNYPITFNVAYPTLKQQLQTHENIDQAIIYTFLKVLAEHPDTLIARKTSSEKAQQISNAAAEILKNSSEKTDAAKKLKKLDRQLRKSSNLLNPGTTADIIAAALALAVLNGYRP